MGHPTPTRTYTCTMTAGGIFKSVNYIGIITEYYIMFHSTIIPMRNNLSMYYFMLISIGSSRIHIVPRGVCLDLTTGSGYSERLSVALSYNCTWIDGVRYFKGRLKLVYQE